MKVLDLFCGIGGFSSGFSQLGHDISGAELSQFSCNTYNSNKIGTAIQTDLSKATVRGKYDVIIGGPPCKPWSNVNRHNRKEKHKDYGLVKVFFKHVLVNRPQVFIFENVPPIANDEYFINLVTKMKKVYSIDSDIIRYSDYGAATQRKRHILVGSLNFDASDFFKELEKHKKTANTVKDVIWDLRKLHAGEYNDHEWPNLKTINKYQKYYKTGKYGWYVLKWNMPSPSFGSIMKTYILHPSARRSNAKRVISIREAMSIMGFDKEEFNFPENAGLGQRYQAVVDSVSPVFSRVAAEVVTSFI